jgi:hypothetical protein
MNLRIKWRMLHRRGNVQVVNPSMQLCIACDESRKTDAVSIPSWVAKVRGYAQLMPSRGHCPAMNRYRWTYFSWGGPIAPCSTGWMSGISYPRPGDTIPGLMFASSGPAPLAGGRLTSEAPGSIAGHPGDRPRPARTKAFRKRGEPIVDRPMAVTHAVGRGERPPAEVGGSPPTQLPI